MKNTIQVTRTEMREILRNWGYGSQTASVQYITDAKLTPEGKKKFGKVKKVANIGCMIGYVYPNSVNNQREREGLLRDFLAEKLWKGAGERISTALSTHKTKGTFYLTLKKQRTFRSFYFDGNGNQLTIEQLKPYFPVSDNNSGRQGVKTPVRHREIMLENVQKIKFKKTTHELV